MIFYDLKRMFLEKKFLFFIIISMVINIIFFVYFHNTNSSSYLSEFNSHEYILDNNYLNKNIKSIQESNSIKNNNEEYVKDFINRVYSPIGNYNEDTVYSVNMPLNIYQKRNNQVKLLLDERQTCNNNKKVILKKINNLNKKNKILDYRLWETAYSSLGVIEIMLVLILIINISSYISTETNTGMDLIIYNGSLKEKINTKIIEISLYSIILFVANLLVLLIMLNISFGFSGAEANIHIYSELFSSIYDFTFIESFFICLLLYGLFLILVGQITLFVNYVLKDISSSILTCIFIIFSPLFLQRIANDRSKLSLIFDFSIYNYLTPIIPLKELRVYNIFGSIYVDKIYMLLIFNIVAILITICLTYMYKIFKRSNYE